MRLLLILSVVLALAVPAASLAHASGASGSTTEKIVAKKKKKRTSARKATTSASTTHREREVKGVITALSASSITVGPLTCAIPTGRVLIGFATGDLVELECKQVAGTWTLRKVKHEDDAQNQNADEREAKGTISALSASSITVGSLTCAIPSGTVLTGFAQGDMVELECELVGGKLTLTKLKHEDDDEAVGQDDDHSGSGHDGDDDDDHSGSGHDGDDDHSGSGSDDD